MMTTTISSFSTLLEQLNALQVALVGQLHHITETLAEEELSPIHQNMLLRGELLATLNQLLQPDGVDQALVDRFNQLDSALGQALTAYQQTLKTRLNKASKQRSGLSQYALAGHLPAEILYRDEA